MEKEIKSATVMALINSIASGSFKGNELLLVVPGGTIWGKPALYGDIVADSINDIPKDRWSAATMASEVFPHTKDVSGASIILYDAEIQVGGITATIDSVIVFLDDVVAVTVAGASEDE